MRRIPGWWLAGLVLGVFSGGLGQAGPCDAQKEALKAKKEACKGLPKDQRAACRAERKQLKEALQACKAEAKSKDSVDPK